MANDFLHERPIHFPSDHSATKQKRMQIRLYKIDNCQAHHSFVAESVSIAQAYHPERSISNHRFHFHSGETARSEVELIGILGHLAEALCVTQNDNAQNKNKQQISDKIP